MAEPDELVFVDSLLDNYKDVQGTLIPMRIQGVQGETVVLDITLVQARFADGFEAETFAKP